MSFATVNLHLKRAMSKASGEPTLELLRRVTDWEWTIGLDAALLQDQFYTGTTLSVPVTPSELAAHRTALRHFVASRELSRDGLTVLTAVQLKLERAFDDSDDVSDRRLVDLDATASHRKRDVTVPEGSAASRGEQLIERTRVDVIVQPLVEVDGVDAFHPGEGRDDRGTHRFT